MLLALSLALCPPTGLRVTCVHDGDSIVVERERIRIETIDTPELNGRCAYERDLAVQARNRLAELLGGDFQIERTGTDRYRRTLARLTVQGRDVGGQLVEEGLARRWEGRRLPWCR